MAAQAGSEELHSVLAERIGTHVKRLDQLILAAKTEALRPLGLTVPQYATLLSIRHLQPTSAAQLARAALTTAQTMSTVLANLESKGLIARDVSAMHAKVFEVRLTDVGLDAVAACDRIALGIEAKLRAGIGEQRFSDLVETARLIESMLARPGGSGAT